MSLDKIKNIIFQYCQHIGFMKTWSPGEGVSAASKRDYPKAFLRQAQALLDSDRLLDYADLLLHNYQPPKSQQKKWTNLICDKIEQFNYDLINSLIDKGYQFKPQEAWWLLGNEAFHSEKYNNAKIQEYFKHNLNAAFPTFLEKIQREIKSTQYTMYMDMDYRAVVETNVAQRARQIKSNNTWLRQLWKFAQNEPAHYEQCLELVNYQDSFLTKHYGSNLQLDIFKPLAEQANTLRHLKNSILKHIAEVDEQKDKIVGMTDFLEQHNSSHQILEAAESLSKEIKTKKLEPHIKALIDDISRTHKALENSSDPEVAFESKNVVEKTVPQLLSVYLSFPEEYRKSFKNDKGQSPEALLVIGLSQQLDILKDFEHRALILKTKEMEALNLYGHNKKMALGK